MTFPVNGVVAPAQSEGTVPLRRCKPDLVADSTACDTARPGLGRSAVESVRVLLATQVAHLGRDNDALRSFAVARPPAEPIRDDESDQSPGDQEQRKPNDRAEIHRLTLHRFPSAAYAPTAPSATSPHSISQVRAHNVGKTSTRRCYLVDVACRVNGACRRRSGAFWSASMRAAPRCFSWCACS